MQTDYIVPNLRAIDDEIASRVARLADLYENPPKVEHPFNEQEWKQALEGHPKREHYLNMLFQGWPLGIPVEDRDPSDLCSKIRNIANSKSDIICMLDKIEKELLKGMIEPGWGWFNLGLLIAGKKDASTGFMTGSRVARHGSYSTAKTVAINDKIVLESESLPSVSAKTPRIPDYLLFFIAVEYATLRDLKDAFRQMLLALDDQQYMQYCIFAMPFRDKRQAYGVSSAGFNCQDFALLICWILENKCPEFKDEYAHLLAYIDDFLFGNGGLDALTCNQRMTVAFDDLLFKLGVNVSIEKNEDNIQIGVAHGIGFNLRKRPKTVFIPKRKVTDMIYGALSMVKYRYATERAVQSMSGKIMHYSWYHPQAKILANRGMRIVNIALLRSKKRRRKGSGVRIYDMLPWSSELLFWAKFLVWYREVAVIDLVYEPSIEIIASTDACSYGAGFVCANLYFMYEFCDTDNQYGHNHASMHINLQEMHCVIQMLHTFKEDLSGRVLWLFVDNKTDMYCLFKSWSGSVALREYTYEASAILIKYHIRLRVDYVPTDCNTPPDLLSRFANKGLNREQLFRDKMGYLFGLKPLDAADFDYYESLRLMRAPVDVPEWESFVDHSGRELVPELLQLLKH